MRFKFFLLEVCMALLSGVLYSLARDDKPSRKSKTGLCELVCAEKPSSDIVRIVPYFVLPVTGSSGREHSKQ